VRGRGGRSRTAMEGHKDAKWGRMKCPTLSHEVPPCYPIQVNPNSNLNKHTILIINKLNNLNLKIK
jgi:hypothetical protein